MEGEVIAGIDIGGTQIKAAAFGVDGCQLATALTPGEALRGASWLESVRDALTSLENQTGKRITRVGIAAPGLAARDRTCIHTMPGRLHGLVGLNWTEFLGRPYPVPVLNDAHAALLGEVWCGAARGVRDCFLLTLGTGVGGAFLCDGRLVTGHIGRAGHLGHISLDPNGPLDIVGTPGSLEDIIGNHNVAQRSRGRFTMTRDLLAAASAGDAEAADVWHQSVRALAAGIVSLINVLDPELILLGGGIMAAGEQLLQPLREEMERIEWRPHDQPVRLVTAQLGELAGACGAARAAMEREISSPRPTG